MSEATKQATAELRRELARLRRQLRAERHRVEPTLRWFRDQEQRMAQMERRP